LWVVKPVKEEKKEKLRKKNHVKRDLPVFWLITALNIQPQTVVKNQWHCIMVRR
jgi:hypothetical protein